ncbi:MULTISPECIES: tRNA pseudouridine(55) synthase TruB [Gordonia]|uniref:tRNA pseudouridine synthase B n=1 Tax=Gordonia sihwensis NBRC 108236 TaxID=1223544 RepID=L7LJB2_9ACTN|nr:MULTISPECIES: tRNA pseudouridine(55) synthase TruB [Gordonia]AUH69257.1 tRNA pseudouridine(55) synthase TruB [Gordonia sp. YC-JH1]MBY4569790.1 tRNA pseudouridine(55) synthase TruB [Gordonia sihwensis]GAC60826.1 tRNA pseudouridine synthase B [Gordonia sihwensis NBRC 108236]
MADASIENAGLLVVDKAAGITSHDVVAKCRKAFNTRRVGHAGTLDPMATGVLVIGIERATKLLGLLSLTTKSYAATIRLGQSTSTDDAEGEVIESRDASGVRDEEIAAVVASLTGDIEQVPAKVSAIKVDGRRAHALVRTGAEFELQARPVTVDRFDVVDTRRDGEFIDLDVEVDCSSGTYIRSLARDLGAALGVGGHLTALRRTAVGPFTLEHSRTMADVDENPGLSLGIDDAAKLCFPHRAISDDEAESISQGRWLEPVGMKGIYTVVDPRGQAIALVQEKGKRASSVMVVRPATLR